MRGSWEASPAELSGASCHFAPFTAFFHSWRRRLHLMDPARCPLAFPLVFGSDKQSVQVVLWYSSSDIPCGHFVCQ